MAETARQWRAEFDAHVAFSNGGDLRTQGFRLDIPDRGIDDEELGEMFVRHLGLLMVDRVTITRKALIQEQHKGSRGVEVAAESRRVVELDGPAARCELNGRAKLTDLVDLPGAVVRVLDSAAATVGRPTLAPFEVLGRAMVLHTGGRSVLTEDGADWLAARKAALVATDATSIGSAGAVLRTAGIPVLTGLSGLDLLPPSGFRLHAVPLPRDGDPWSPVPAGVAWPVRAYVIIEGN